MNTIEFSHKYTKLPAGIKTARLVACEAVRLGAQIWPFISYDTQFRGSDGLLRCGEVFDYWSDTDENDIDMLLLCLISDSGAFFTTLRKDNFENRAKYMCQLCGSNGWTPLYNKHFQIIVKES